jgi:TPR repeat protein
MTRVWSVLLVAIFVCVYVSIPTNPDEVQAMGSQQLNPKAAQQFASDSEKAANGDPDAAYRIGEAFESGRLGGLKELKKALGFYKMAAQKGRQDAAARIAQIESELRLNQNKQASSPISPAH